MFQICKISLIIFCFIEIAWAQEPRVKNAIEEINSLREALVLGVVPPVDPKKIKDACGPVGKQAKKTGEENGWTIRQASHKYRNLDNKATKIEQEAISAFQKDRSKKSYWKETGSGSYYFRRIDVKPACLLCHGAKVSRAEFIKKKYPQDKAFDFKVGDLRGVYSVFVPKLKKDH